MQPGKLRKAMRGESGQSMVEFALTLPLLLLLVLGTIDLGMGFKTYIALTNAAREGARSITIYPANEELACIRIGAEASSVGQPDAGCPSGQADAVLGSNTYQVTFSYDDVNNWVTVSVHHEYELLLADLLNGLIELLGGLVEIPDSINFTASTTMVVLYDE